MLGINPYESSLLKHHLETSVVFVPMQSTPIFDETTLEENKSTTFVVRRKQIAKIKASPSKFKAKKRTKFCELSQKDSHIGSRPDSRS